MINKVLKIQLIIYNSHSLKDKRSVLKSIMERLKKRFNISIAEVADNEIWNKATIGVSSISNSDLGCQQVLEQVIKFIDNDDRAEIIKVEKF